MCSLLFLKATWQVYINLSISDSANETQLGRAIVQLGSGRAKAIGSAIANWGRAALSD